MLIKYNTGIDLL